MPEASSSSIAPRSETRGGTHRMFLRGTGRSFETTLPSRSATDGTNSNTRRGRGVCGGLSDGGGDSHEAAGFGIMYRSGGENEGGISFHPGGTEPNGVRAKSMNIGRPFCTTVPEGGSDKYKLQAVEKHNREAVDIGYSGDEGSNAEVSRNASNEACGD
ncbi:hypothetical protein NDU88_000839 [Pleurodeles waltl]|uniref:Uncharacterized protein n=1 Tax=Pleurodeles waltl TaxID=8319 RepID=A0AAV7Q571_PLEWA|nr:hypothetical protein NDU88_000839 [Pleurodeles waltl]